MNEPELPPFIRFTIHTKISSWLLFDLPKNRAACCVS